MGRGSMAHAGARLWAAATGTWSGRWLLTSMSVAAIVRLVVDGGTVDTLALLALILLPLERLGFAWSSWDASRRRRRRRERRSRTPTDGAGSIRSPRLRYTVPDWSDRTTIREISLAPDALARNGWGPEQVAHLEKVLSSRLLFKATHGISLLCRRLDGDKPAVLIQVGVLRHETRSGLNVSIAVHPDQRRQGFAAEAFGAALPALRTRKQAWIGTAVDNDPIRRIMAGLGYEESAPEPHTLPGGDIIEGVWYKVPTRRSPWFAPVSWQGPPGTTTATPPEDRSATDRP